MNVPRKRTGRKRQLRMRNRAQAQVRCDLCFPIGSYFHLRACSNARAWPYANTSRRPSLTCAARWSAPKLYARVPESTQSKLDNEARRTRRPECRAVALVEKSQHVGYEQNRSEEHTS